MAKNRKGNEEELSGMFQVYEHRPPFERNQVFVIGNEGAILHYLYNEGPKNAEEAERILNDVKKQDISILVHGPNSPILGRDFMMIDASQAANAVQTVIEKWDGERAKFAEDLNVHLNKFKKFIEPSERDVAHKKACKFLGDNIRYVPKSLRDRVKKVIESDPRKKSGIPMMIEILSGVSKAVSPNSGHSR